MAKRQQKDIKIKIIEAAFKLAASRAWNDITLSDIAKACKMTLGQLRGHFDDKSDILAAFGRMVDKRVLEAVGKGDSEASRDRLFDILMERFDILNEYRNELVPILKSFRNDPKQLVIALSHSCKSMNWMLEAAGLDANGMQGALRLAGLTGVYIKTLKIWMEDESEDMGKTMAALDRDLGRAEKLANSLGL